MLLLKKGLRHVLCVVSAIPLSLVAFIVVLGYLVLRQEQDWERELEEDSNANPDARD